MEIRWTSFRDIRAVFVLVLVLWACDCAGAGSIWAKRTKGMKSLYADDVARGIGDTLTIKVSEASKVDNKGKRDLKKETGRSAEFDGELGIDNILESIPGFTMSADSSNELKSKADFKDERSFEDRVSVVVMDVLPNGNLVVAGTRDRRIAGDVQTIEVSGLVRPSDIAFDNTVQSEQVANFRIVTKNKGVSAPYTRPGWVGRIFDVLWPW
ncbi:MAG: flagellar basal body L-ring protein FlgH [Sedimentisphaerales bacterium]|nr:flagellar basal body L-ring protein FlgH [Sedimentisphaerales bacterium]